MNEKILIPGALLGALLLGGCYLEDPNGCSDCSPTQPIGSIDPDEDQDGYNDLDGDCNDTDPQVYPGAPELDDDTDNDCDGQIDEGLGSEPTPTDETPDPETPEPETPTEPPPTPTPEPTDISPDIVLPGPSDAPSTVISDLRWIGDLDGDGYDDIAASVQTGTSGQVFIYYGDGGGLEIRGDLAQSADAVITGIADPDTNGVRLGIGGDVNGDGYDDLLLGDVYHRRVVLYQGSAARLSGEITQDQSTAIFHSFEQGSYAVGLGLAIVPDMNFDGKDEIAIGAPTYSFAKGQLALFYGREGFGGVIDISHADSHFLGQVDGGATGSQVFGLSDINGDGFGDMAIVSSNHPLDYDAPTNGILSIVYGSESLAPAQVSIADLPAIAAPPSGSMVGMQLDSGDMNGDGHRDIVLGLPTDGTSHGSAFILFGDGEKASGIQSLEAISSRVIGMDDRDFAFGASVALSGDITGNGRHDLVVASPLLIEDGNSFSAAGGFTDPADLDTSPGYGVIFAGNEPKELYDSGDYAWGYIDAHDLGFDALWPVVTGGDLNGDGHGDLLMGATAFTEDGQTISSILVKTQ